MKSPNNGPPCAESTNLKGNAGKVKSSFDIRVALWTKKLGRCPEYCRSWKNTLEKLVVAVNLEAIWFEFWMKGALVTVEIFVFRGWRFSNHFDGCSVGDTFYLQCSWPWAVVSYTLLAAVPWNGLEHSHRESKVTRLIFRSDVLTFHSWHQSVCQRLFWDWGKLNILNKLISETFCLLGLLNSR